MKNLTIFILLACSGLNLFSQDNGSGIDTTVPKANSFQKFSDSQNLKFTIKVDVLIPILAALQEQSAAQVGFDFNFRKHQAVGFKVGFTADESTYEQDFEMKVNIGYRYYFGKRRMYSGLYSTLNFVMQSRNHKFSHKYDSYSENLEYNEERIGGSICSGYKIKFNKRWSIDLSTGIELLSKPKTDVITDSHMLFKESNKTKTGALFGLCIGFEI